MAGTEVTSKYILEGEATGLVAAMEKGRRAVKEGTASMTTSFDAITMAAGKIPGAIAAISAIVAGGAMKDAVNKTVEWTGEAVKLSKTLGITTESASILNVALGDIYTTSDVFAAAALKLDKQIQKNEEGLNSLGLVTRDGNRNLLDQETLVLNAIKVWKSYEEGTDRNIVGQKLFGKGVEDLVKLQKLNAEVMGEARRKADELSLTVDSDRVEKVKKYKAAVNDFEDAILAGKVAAGELLPVLTDLTNSFAELAGPKIKPFANFMHDLVIDAKEIREAFGSAFGNPIEAKTDRLKNILFGGMSIEEADREYKAQLETLGAGSEAYIRKLESRISGVKRDAFSYSKSEIDEMRKQFQESQSVGKKAPGGAPGEQEAADSLRKLLEGAKNDEYMQLVDETIRGVKIETEAKRDALMEQYTDVVANVKLIGDANQEALLERYTDVVDEVRIVREATEEELAQRIEYAQESAAVERAAAEKTSELRASALQSRLQFMGEEHAALDVEFAYRAQREEEEYQRKLNYARQIGADMQAIDAERLAAREARETEYAQRQAQLWWSSAQKYIGFAQQMSTMAVSLLFAEEGQRGQIGKRMLATSVRFLAQGLQQFMFHKAQEHLFNAAAALGRTATDTAASVANLSLLEIQAAAWAAYYAAHAANPVGAAIFGVSAGAMGFVATEVVPGAIAASGTAGAVSFGAELGMAAAWTAGGILVGAVGEAGAQAIEGNGSGGAAGYGAGTPGSPVVTTPPPQVAATPAAPVINLHVYGNIVDQDKFAREIIPALKTALADGVH